MNTTVFNTICAMTVLLAVATGCDDLSDDLNRLRENRAVWQSMEIHDYALEFRAGCFCGSGFTETVTVQVRADTILSVTVTATGLPAMLDKDEWFTVDELFDAAETVIKKADDFDITYNAEFGFPDRISADMYINAIDDEFVYTVLQFEVK